MTNLCPCLREKCLAQTRVCANCGQSRCQGVLVPDTNTGIMTRTFFCKNRSPQDVEHGRGAILDDGENGNMSQSQTRNKCRDCETRRKEHLICTFEGCTKIGDRKGQRCKTHQLDMKICTFEGCTKVGCHKGQRCKTHQLVKKICTFEGCTKIGGEKGQRCKTHQLDKKICTFKGCTKLGCHKGQRCKTHKDKRQGDTANLPGGGR